MKCWICGENANSKEHKFKASDIKRIYGKKFDGYLVHKTPTKIISYKDRILKFPEVICDVCNIKTTRPHDDAYDLFIDYCLENYHFFVQNRFIDFEKIYGQNWIKQKRNLYRYFAKHAGCKIVTSDYPQDLKDIADFILGAEYTEKFVVKFEIKMVIKVLIDYYKREVRKQHGHLYNSPTLYFGYYENLNLAGWLSNHWITSNWIYSKNVDSNKKLDFNQKCEKLKITDLDYYDLVGVTDYETMINHFELGELNTLDKKIAHFESLIK